jgi:cell fate (sporulation/competence/biofilm development) regulator YlbF (YheA/YmcA/DUF963 family)
MWIDEVTYNSIIKRIENLESNQFQANERVKQYIEDSEALSNKLCELINALPKLLEKSLKELLKNNCCDK